MDVHKKAAAVIKEALSERVIGAKNCFIIAIAGESGSGKTLTSNAIIEEFKALNINAIVLRQDYYFKLPPFENDKQRKADPTWLGPHKEVDMELLDQNIQSAKDGAEKLSIQRIDYDSGIKSNSDISLKDIQLIIVEGTYTSLLRNTDARIFIDEDYHDTLKFRKLRNRGNEVNDPFVEGILETEHKIIAGHKFLADFIITKNYDVIVK